MNYDMDMWISFIKENWLFLIIALLALFIVVRVVKTVIKWALVAIIVIVVIVYSGYNLGDLKSQWDEIAAVGSQVADNVKQEALQAMVGEADDALYKTNEDGTYTVTTKNVELKGKAGENEVNVYYRNAPLGKWKIDETLKMLIEKSKAN
ncbi:hypothetical protein EBB07_04095 [Paenibacillaceae bacterium]|nr:hypothetical protein EBB07_04095 [Paenibacillaceae bacterium]